MKNELFTTRNLAGAVGTAAIGAAMAGSPVFAGQDLHHGYQQGGQSASGALMLAEGACGGFAGGETEREREKDSEGACGAFSGDEQDREREREKERDRDKDAEGACGEGAADDEDKDAEGACGEGTCGG